MAGSPKKMDAPRQPTAAMSGAPMTATTTVPTLPPAMWALMAKPRRSGGNCSDSRPLPTGCWGDPPMRDAIFGIANVAKLVANAWSAKPPPNSSPPKPEQVAPRDDPGQPGIAELDEAGGDGGCRREERDGLHADVVVEDDLEEDQRQDDSLRVVDGVGDGQQRQRAHRVDPVIAAASGSPPRWASVSIFSFSLPAADAG